MFIRYKSNRYNCLPYLYEKCLYCLGINLVKISQAVYVYLFSVSSPHRGSAFVSLRSVVFPFLLVHLLPLVVGWTMPDRITSGLPRPSKGRQPGGSGMEMGSILWTPLNLDRIGRDRDRLLWSGDSLPKAM
jgi:hypothetical protein